MGKGRYLLKRFIYIVFVFFIISILMFFIYKIMPGDPVTMMLGDAKANMKPDAYQRLYDQTRENLGLNGPLIVQYIRWIGNMLTGNFGYSTQYKKDVIDMIGTPMLNTVMLNLVSMLVTFLIAVPLGIATAVRKNGVFDKTIQVVTIIGYSLPSFIIALLAIFAFAVKIPIFPISGVRTAGFEGNALQTALDTLWQHHPVCAGRHDRRAAHGLHQDCPGQGPAGKSGYLCPRFPQRPDPRGDHCHRLGGFPVWRLHRH